MGGPRRGRATLVPPCINFANFNLEQKRTDSRSKKFTGEHERAGGAVARTQGMVWGATVTTPCRGVRRHPSTPAHRPAAA